MFNWNQNLRGFDLYVEKFENCKVFTARFARVLPWEFPGFSVNACREQLYHAQTILEQNGVLEGTIHRYLLVTEKPA